MEVDWRQQLAQPAQIGRQNPHHTRDDIEQIFSGGQSLGFLRHPSPQI
jgi:hypothetical protein